MSNANHMLKIAFTHPDILDDVTWYIHMYNYHAAKELLCLQNNCTAAILLYCPNSLLAVAIHEQQQHIHNINICIYVAALVSS